MVYENCRFYGPYLSKKDNRLRCIVVFPDGVKRTISYPKYLMEVHLDRYLEGDETVDHIDGNPLNNEISNLQILPRKLHSYLDTKRYRDAIVTCQMCKKPFLLKGSKLHNCNRGDRNQSGYFCSKQCVGRYGRLIQFGLIKPTTVDRVVPSIYKVKSAQEETSEVEVG